MDIHVDIHNGFAVPEGRIGQVLLQMIRDIKEGIPPAAAPIGQYELTLGLRLAVQSGLIEDICFVFNGQRNPICPNGDLMFPSMPMFPGSVADAQLTELLRM